ncbi:MAG: Abortive infection protein [Bryobacterales bacterium]|nr:Abortive infection protein [Bryobacterales bacterium]
MRRDPLRAAIQAGVFLLLYVVAVYVLGPLAMLVGGYLVGLTIGSLIAAALATAFAMAIFGGRPLIDVGLHWNHLSRTNVLWGIAGGAAAATLVLVPAVLFHAAHFVASPEAGANWRTLLFVPLLLFCGAAGEELLFHGFAFQVLLREL